MVMKSAFHFVPSIVPSLVSGREERNDRVQSPTYPGANACALHNRDQNRPT